MSVEDLIWMFVSACCGVVASVMWLGRQRQEDVEISRKDSSQKEYEHLQKLFNELK